MNQKTANVSLIRDQNLKLILGYLLHKSGQTSRAELIRVSNLSGTTVSALVNILLNAGFAHETGMGKSIGGRRPITIELNQNYSYFMGVDIGGSHLSGAIIDLKGRPIASHSIQFDVIHNARATLQKVRQIIAQLLDTAKLNLADIAGIGVAIPTPLTGENQDQMLAFYMPDWEGLQVLDELKAISDLPLYLENDANAGAIAEKWWGIGKEYHSLAFIKLGIGVGSGLIINDEIYRGYAGSAGEIGHTTIESAGRLCRCGNRGCMESYVGIPGILMDVRKKASLADANHLSIDTVIAKALAGDAVSKEVIENAGRYLGIAIANLINLMNPGIIVLNGVLMDAGDLIMQEVRASIKERTLPLRSENTPLVASKLGKDVVAIGAATLVIQNSIQLENINKFLFKEVVPETLWISVNCVREFWLTSEWRKERE